VARHVGVEVRDGTARRGRGWRRAMGDRHPGDAELLGLPAGWEQISSN
jgi:hypothetical protein